ncbi:hypothetical protein CEP54_002191 [Fusarium duplospermum]|uniref:BTB domain-containing protein n=1 Tax=Fusarium duplospermum TaxID=1325734 RepID=A0A428QWI6_9HYPO|nr:hypothetical protein CEP54_002191 [Fusarium duplospermum]
MPPKKQKTGTKRKQPEPEPPKEEDEVPFLREIIPGGDVILVVGPRKSKIQLSSHLLRTTSPVFNAMLGPNFKEGTLLRESQGPVEIALPDDNAQALYNVYSTLYGGHPDVNNLSVDEIYDISILAQKYDLVDRLMFGCEAWFRTINKDTYGSIEEDWKMLLAAYWLRSGLGFRNASRMLIQAEHEPLYKHGMETSDQVLGLRLCLAVQEVRMAGYTALGLCLSCFEDPETQEFTTRNLDLVALRHARDRKYGDVEPPCPGPQ